MNHKLIPMLLCTALTVGLFSGCGQKNAPTAPSTEPQTTATAAVKTTEPSGLPHVTTEDVRKALTDGSAVVLDARKTDAYNGWALDGAVRGGHIEGAGSFSADWLTVEYDDVNNLEQQTRAEVLAGYVAEKGLTPDTNVILYDTNGTDAQAVAEYLQEQGHHEALPLRCR